MAKFWAGWRDYRYGDQRSGRKVHDPSKAYGRLLSGQKREHVIEALRVILADWKASPFEHEAACRHGLRAGFCIEGERWAVSDHEAAALVDEALRRNRAARPTWEQGQREHTIPVECCQWCGGEIDQTGLRQDRYCSAMCAKSAYIHREAETTKAASLSHRQALRIIVREQQPLKACKCCGVQFRPSDPTRPSDFCSLACAKTTIPDRECEVCGKTFHPATRHVMTCSIECRSAKARRPVKLLTCLTCGDDFPASQTKRSPFCSESCSTMHRQFAKGYVPKRLTPLAFDHFVTVPVNASLPAWMTPVRFDQLVAERA
jgi:hypothetical protein